MSIFYNKELIYRHYFYFFTEQLHEALNANSEENLPNDASSLLPLSSSPASNEPANIPKLKLHQIVSF